MTTGKTIALTIQNFAGKAISLLLNMSIGFFFYSFPSNEKASFNFVAAVIIGSEFRAQEYKICHSFHLSQFYLHWSDGIDCHDHIFLNAEFQASVLQSQLSPSWKDSNSSLFSAISVVLSAYLRLLIFLPAVLSMKCSTSVKTIKWQNDLSFFSRHNLKSE